MNDTLAQEISKQLNQNIEFYKKLDDSDYEYMQEVAKEFVKNNPNLTPEELFIQGWIKSIEQPLSRSIHLIGMYTQDYLTTKYKDMKNITTHIRNIFRNKSHNLTF